MTPMKKAFTVGISICVMPDTHVWSNGIHQNVAFLAQCLKQVPGIGRVVLLNSGLAEHLPPALEFDALGVPLVKPQEVTHEVDVVIEMGGKLSQQWIRRVKARGAKVVSFLVGHPYTAMVEPAIFERDQSIGMVNMEPDEVWLMHKDMHTSAALLRTLLRAPVVEVPHLWAPDFLWKQIHSLAGVGHAYGFDYPTRSKAVDGWGAGIFEPNIGVVKACFIPMLACDSAYRERPEVVRRMMVMNSVQMKEHLTFNHFAHVLDLTRDGRATYEPRITVPECLSRFGVDVVVSHQWENDQNYLYYDVLYGGYPLVHNSPWLSKRAPGFYYQDFSATEAASKILEAWEMPQEYWRDYRTQAHAFLAQLHPEHDDNVRFFSRQMDRLTGVDSGGAP